MGKEKSRGIAGEILSFLSYTLGSCSWDYVPDYSLCGAENLREWKFHGKYVKRRR